MTGSYQVGDEVNGHRWDGLAWVPVAPPGPPPLVAWIERGDLEAGVVDADLFPATAGVAGGPPRDRSGFRSAGKKVRLVRQPTESSPHAVGVWVEGHGQIGWVDGEDAQGVASLVAKAETGVHEQMGVTPVVMAHAEIETTYYYDDDESPWRPGNVDYDVRLLLSYDIEVKT